MEIYDLNREFLSDKNIIELYFARDERAINETDKKYGKQLLLYAYRFIHDIYASDECKSDTYLRVWQAVPPARPKNFKSFIFSIMRHIAINRFRESNRQKRIFSEMTKSIDELYGVLVSSSSPEKECETLELAECLNSFLEKLSKKHRYMFIGRFYMHKSVEEIASELAMSDSGVRKALKKMANNLKKHLETCGIEL